MLVCNFSINLNSHLGDPIIQLAFNKLSILYRIYLILQGLLPFESTGAVPPLPFCIKFSFPSCCAKYTTLHTIPLLLPLLPSLPLPSPFLLLPPRSAAALLAAKRPSWRRSYTFYRRPPLATPPYPRPRRTVIRAINYTTSKRVRTTITTRIGPSSSIAATIA